ncbi:Uncharacterized conserved protein YcbK, DUF882 family [Albimonas pacifica]|uniref:Murein endopeptidase K n=2 Tax=Albimonas pacifica TaxID=1114924 RepID=A0A1I3KA91_9RHOB|nr:Uncharacterized conserved protein YcbK, DUF882 family [Albimonas pacifica]
MKPTDFGRLSRRAALVGLAGGLVAAGMGGQALAAPSLNTGKGAYRRIQLVNSRLQERLDAVYWIDGEYVPEALQEISGILRDWRADLVKPYHERALDVLAAAHRKMDVDEPFEVVSGYRSPQTNAAMRQRSSGVARNSYHTRAMAVDVKLKSRSVRQIAGAAESLSAGGVGRYSRSNFVHMDCGPVRTWGA